jgi:hypothetical protein
VRAAEACGRDADRLVRLVGRDAEGGDRLARGPQSLLLGRGRDQDLSEVDNADEQTRVAALPPAEERAGAAVERIVAVQRADQDVGVEDDPHRSASSRSSRSK